MYRQKGEREREREGGERERDFMRIVPTLVSLIKHVYVY